MATYTEHALVKQEKFAPAVAGFVQKKVVLPNLFTRKGFDDFKGAIGDTLNMKVPGKLPFRTYEFRNDRSEPIQYDVYEEHKIALKITGQKYSAVRITDEQKDFDLDQGWAPLLEEQAAAVARGVEFECYSALTSAPYEVEIGMNEDAPRFAITEARRVLNRFQAEPGNRVLLVGSDVDLVMQNDPHFNLAMNVGDVAASSALQNAIIGRYKGFTVIQHSDIAPDEAYAMTPDAFALLLAAPSAPTGAPQASTVAWNGYAFRWICDYDTDYQYDRSVVSTWVGTQSVKDVLAGTDKNGQAIRTEDAHFIRAIKLKLGGTSKYPAKGTSGAPGVGLVTGLEAPKVLAENQGNPAAEAPGDGA